MKMNFTAGKKLCAMLLCAVMINGAIPAAWASQEQEAVKSPSTLDSASTPDEAGDPDKKRGNELDDFDADNNSVVKKDDVTYVSAKDLKKLTFRAKPGEDVMTMLNNNVDGEVITGLNVKFKKADSESYTPVDNEYCEFGLNEDTLTIVFDFEKFFTDNSDWKKDGAYIFVAEFGEEPTELIKNEFTVVETAPVIPSNQVKFNGNKKSKLQWTNQPVNVEFIVNSVSPVTVTYSVKDSNDTLISTSDPIEPSEGVYSFEISDNNRYILSATDIYNNTTDLNIGNITKIDTVLPEMTGYSFCKEDGTPTGGYYNKNFTVKAVLSDSGSGIDESTIKVMNGENEVDSQVSVDKKTATVSFTDNAVTDNSVVASDYTITFSDIAGNSNSATIGADEFKYDNQSPAANDVTLSFTVNEEDIDKALSMLSFGIYSKKTLHVAAEAKQAGDSDQTVKLYINGSEAETEGKPEGDLSLSDDENSKSFDLRVVVTDEAGNKVEYTLKDNDITTKLTNEAKEILAEYTSVSELILSKVAPTISDDLSSFENFTNVYTKDDKTYVRGNGKISVPVSEEITGISSYKAYIDNEDYTYKTVSSDLSDEKHISLDVETEAKDLPEGERVLYVFATSNSKNEANKEISFTVDNTAPDKTSGFTYNESMTSAWSHEGIVVRFVLADVAGVASVTCKSPTEKDVTVSSDAENGEGAYKFTAEEYGVFTVTAVDELGNSASYPTEAIKFDNVDPEVTENSFTYNGLTELQWTKENVTVEFSAEDLNNGESEISGFDEGSVVVYYVNGEALEQVAVTNPNTEGKCSFTAEKYGHYKVKLTDRAGNDKTFDVGEETTNILIDKLAPSVKEVRFSEGNVRKHGTYSKADSVTMTVVVDNNKGGFAECSPLTAGSVEVLNNKKQPAKNITPVENGVRQDAEDENIWYYDFTITCDKNKELTKDDINVIFRTTDSVGNSEEAFLIENKGIQKIVDENFNNTVYDVLVTLATANISDIEKTGKANGDQTIFHGASVKLTSTITDEMAGIDEIKAEYGMVPLDQVISDENDGYLSLQLDNDLTNELYSELNASEDKQTTASLDYDLDTKESGRYIFRLTVKNNAGNTCYKYVDFLVDNTEPVVDEIIVSGDIRAQSNEGVYLNAGDNTLTVIAHDDDPTAEITSIVVKNGESTLDPNSEPALVYNAENGSYTAVFKLNNGSCYDNLSVTVTDSFGQTNSVTAPEKIGVTVGEHKYTPDYLSEDVFEIVVVSSENSAGHFEESSYSYNMTYSNNSDKIYKRTNGDSNKKDIISTDIENTFAGVQNVEVYVDGNKLTDDAFLVTYSDQNKQKKTKAHIEIYTEKLIGLHIIPYGASSEHKIYYTVQDKSLNNFTSAEETFSLDETAPVVTNISFGLNEYSPGEKMLNILTFGVYSNENIEATVTVTDITPSSQLDSNGIKMKYKDNAGKEKELQGKSFTYVKEEGGKKFYTKVFTLPKGAEKDNSFFNNLWVEVSDKFENSNKNDTNTNVVAKFNNEGGSQTITLADTFDIVAYSKPNAPSIEFKKPTVTDASHSYQNNQENWYADNPVVHFSVKDDVSKIHKVQVIVNEGTEKQYVATNDCKYSFKENSNKVEVPADFTFTTFNDDNEDTKVSQIFADLDTAGIELLDGENKVTVTAWGNNGESNTQTVKFYMDTTDPVIDGIKYESNASTGEKVLNLLTFGLYSNNDIKITVKVKDNKASSGISNDGIQISSASGTYEVETDSFISLGDGLYTKEFILKRGTDASDSFFNDLVVTANDNVKNETSNNFYDLYSLYSNGEDVEFDPNEGFDLVASNYKPQIDDLKATPGGTAYPEGNAEDSGRYFSAPPMIATTITDDVSKIQSVEVTVNGTTVTEKCVLTKTEPATATLPSSGVFTYPERNGKGDPDIEVSKMNVTLNTAGVEVHEGVNTVVIKATGNNNESSEKSIEFILDTTNPVITDFAFNNISYQKLPYAGLKGPGQFYDPENYGFFFQEQTTVTVTATDNVIEGVTGSGVKTIVLYTKEVNGKEIEYGHQEADDDNKAQFVINGNFKGRLRAAAIDNVDNNSDLNDRYTPESIVVEKKEMYDESTKVTFNYAANSYTDNKNQRLYDSPTNITFTAKSSFAGIKAVEYIIHTPTVNNSQTITVDDTGNISDSSVTSVVRERDSNEKFVNIVDQFTKSVAIPYNSNDIRLEVKVTDYAGFSSYSNLSDYISIDTTNPEIYDITFDNNDGNVVSGTTYYKANRTATIRIKERNFNPDQAHFKLNITNTDGTIPTLVPGSNWNTTYSINVANPDDIIHEATVLFDADGDYTMSVQFTDLAGRKAADKKAPDFTIDKTAPVIQDVSWSTTPGKDPYFSDTRTATITVREHNFNSDYFELSYPTATSADNSTPVTGPRISGWTPSGDLHTATITFADEGKFEFTVKCRDSALNDSNQVQSGLFYIDKTKPKIDFDGVENKHAYNGVIAPKIEYSDYNFDQTEYTFTLIRYKSNGEHEKVTEFNPLKSSTLTTALVSYDNFVKHFGNDGVYKLTATATDLAGNNEQKETIFSVNRFGSNFYIDDADTLDVATVNRYTQKAPDIKVKEINVNKITEAKVQINYNETTRNLKNGEDYKTTETGGTGTEWYCCEYSINASNYDQEGNYNTVITSTDYFKNTITNRNAYVQSEEEIPEGSDIEPEDRRCPVEFVVDKTKPIISISGISSNEYYEEPEKDVTIICDDTNITLKDFNINLDGKDLKINKDYTAEEVDGSIEAKIKLSSEDSTGDRTFKVTVFDKAKNSENKEVSEFRLNASWFARLLHYHLPLVIIIGAAVVLLIGFLIFLIVRKRKKANK